MGIHAPLPSPIVIGRARADYPPVMWTMRQTPPENGEPIRYRADGVGKERAAMNQERERRIRERAYELWMQEGCESGRAEHYWLKAEREMSESDPSPAHSSQMSGGGGSGSTLDQRPPQAAGLPSSPPETPAISRGRKSRNSASPEKDAGAPAPDGKPRRKRTPRTS